MTLHDYFVLWALIVCTALGATVGYSKGWAEADAYRKCMDSTEAPRC